jgi:hypothetical protein
VIGVGLIPLVGGTILILAFMGPEWLWFGDLQEIPPDIMRRFHRTRLLAGVLFLVAILSLEVTSIRSVIIWSMHVSSRFSSNFAIASLLWSFAFGIASIVMLVRLKRIVREARERAAGK